MITNSKKKITVEMLNFHLSVANCAISGSIEGKTISVQAQFVIYISVLLMFALNIRMQQEAEWQFTTRE